MWLKSRRFHNAGPSWMWRNMPKVPCGSHIDCPCIGDCPLALFDARFELQAICFAVAILGHACLTCPQIASAFGGWGSGVT